MENNSRKRRILPNFVKNICPVSKKRRLEQPTKSIKNQLDYLPNDMLKLIFKFSHTGKNIAESDKFILKYKFCCNENIIYFQHRLKKFLKRYKPSENDIEDFIILISKKHEEYKLNSLTYPQSLIIIRQIICGYFHGWAMRMKIDSNCKCRRDCYFCIVRRIKIGYLLHILDKNYYICEQLTSLKVQKVLFMYYKQSRVTNLSKDNLIDRQLSSSFNISKNNREWIQLLFNDILYNSSSKVYINNWKV